MLTTIAHPRSTRQRRQRLAQVKGVEIGNDVCLGAGVTVLAGVKIGDNVVVEAGAVVGSPGSARQRGLCRHPGQENR
ncbi:DapH/DapD/GlmU-related protein [Lactobacillus delbrueckii]|uniref:DapH/DapD/GlmU-related protein n=1 Tax=Lactobacillus delbrueckii TaxID=1584 RepID=UPI00385387C5